MVGAFFGYTYIFTDQTVGIVLQNHLEAIRLSAGIMSQPRTGLVRRVNRIAKTELMRPGTSRGRSHALPRKH